METDWLNVSEYQLLCRLCLKKGNKLNRLFFLNDDDLIKKVFEATSIEITLDDIFPNQICAKCKKCLDQCLEFRNSSLKSDTLIRLHYLLHGESNEQDGFSDINNKDLINEPEYSIEPEESENTSEEKTKRKRGRPRKTVADNITDDNNTIQELVEENGIRKSTRVRKINPKFSDNCNSEDDENIDENVQTVMPEFLENGDEWIEPKFINSENSSPPSLSYYVQKTQPKLLKTDPCTPKPKNYALTSRCELCDVILPTKDMKHHINEHNKCYPYKCELCEKMFSSPLKRSKHKAFVHSTNFFSCNSCDLTFKSINNLRRHEKGVHLKLFACECEICHTKFTTREAYKRHLMIHNDHKPFFCSFCNKSFRTTFNLKTHERIHLKIKPFKCEICDAVFGYNFALKKHVQKEHLEELNESSSI